MNRQSTDITLWDWRYGQTQAERLCAEILLLDGFSSIDPQCPLGGPDGRKDILCMRGNVKWLAAVYFPPTRSVFKDVAEKFRYDIEGVNKHKRDGFSFLTNQLITPSQRAELALFADPIPVEIYHQERIRSLLDSPKGYGLRLEYLRIPMTEEEQHSFWSTLKDDIMSRLNRQEAGIMALHEKVDLILYRYLSPAERKQKLDEEIKNIEMEAINRDTVTSILNGKPLSLEMEGTGISVRNSTRHVYFLAEELAFHEIEHEFGTLVQRKISSC